MAEELDNVKSNRKRTFKPKVRTGCITCKTRRVKCDEGKPACSRCLRTGRTCDGYESSKPLVAIPRALAPAPAVESPLEARALELFFHKSAKQLAGSFEGAFFQGSVAQSSLVEPTIRNAIAAIAVLHEEMLSHPAERERSIQGQELPTQFYNRAIRALLQKLKTEQTSISLTFMANILFTCFEYFRGNLTAARSHVKSGINLLESWRGNTRPLSYKPWGQSYDSHESYFMETEIAPLLSVFRTNILEEEDAKEKGFFLNPVDRNGIVVLGDRFDNIQQARVGLLDVITSTFTSRQFEPPDHHSPTKDQAAEMVDHNTQNVDEIISQWQSNFDDLVFRKGSSWGYRERQAASVVRIIEMAETLGRRNYLAGNECSWDSARAEYGEMLSIADSLISDLSRFPHDGFRLLSLDFGKLFCFHLLAWKCRWPSLRRWALSLLRKVPKREWLLDAKHYHAIFSRIMEIEEANINAVPEEIIQRDMLPPEHSRIYDFTVLVQTYSSSSSTSSSPSSPSSSTGVAYYAVTFWSKPMGHDGPVSSVTEHIQSESSYPGETAVPLNLIAQHYSHLQGPRKQMEIGPRTVRGLEFDE
ncbi:Putative C6 zinc finger domain-containing protein [Penicillium brasilianum]|uniref:Putative C6 zinc finger domain-containing protein n=1 Tax=Penicillium brasilianum TaxID=104259 RepID=A0A0F7VF66_PENBI|nr:Putative C6 zinc finger domain-containing protein [Penicillium brasilianum]